MTETIDKYVSKAMTKIFGIDLLLLMEDTVYVMKRENHSPDFQDKI